ncbi:HAD-IA family hydrolase [Microbacterium hominis]|uniref:HAD-IA family hydrolase n=1 Tax=Microbacterium hominis TaxID=162426 RepID=UPI00068B43CA|nr:HAD-IA family hydrolase [Microbacterium hominis]
MTAAPALVLFDLGGVLSSAPQRFETLGRVAGVDASALVEPYWRHRDEYDLGASDEHYWRAVIRGVGAGEPGPDVVAHLARVDAESATRIRPAAAAILRAVAASGAEVGIVSNAPRAMATRARERGWARSVTHWFFSAEIGLAKPDARLFAHVAKELGVRDPGRIVFIDDRAENVDAARAAGWTAHVWVSDLALAASVGVSARDVVARRTVAFDLGEVLASAPALFGAFAARAGSVVSELSAAYWRHRDGHDRGAPASWFWTAVLADLGIGADDDLIADLARMDAEAWTDIRPAARATLRALSEAAVPLAVVSNAPRELAEAARSREWAPLIDDWFFSGELGVLKPEAAIYAHVQEVLDVDGRDLLFFDDRPANVAAACRAGWDARLWESDRVTADTVAALLSADPPDAS